MLLGPVSQGPTTGSAWQAAGEAAELCADSRPAYQECPVGRAHAGDEGPVWAKGALPEQHLGKQVLSPTGIGARHLVGISALICSPAAPRPPLPP